AMVRLAELRPGHVVLDPMCGAGTILAEAARSLGRSAEPALPILGGDVDRAAVRAARANLESLANIALARWDARALPLADQSIDRVICNLPFGKKLMEPEEIPGLYRDLLPEWDRVLRPGGRAVLLVADAAALQDAVRRLPWKAGRRLRVRVLGQL